MARQLINFSLLALCLIGILKAQGAEYAPDVLYTSPSGRLRLELVRAGEPGAEEDTYDVWLVSSKDPTHRVKLPKQASDSPTDDEFHFSPNEEWLFGLRHVGSGLRYGNIYHLISPSKVEPVGQSGFFDELVWETA